MVDSLWHHAGKGTEAVYCLKQGTTVKYIHTNNINTHVNHVV